MKVKNKKRRKFSENIKKHFRRKQDTFLQSGTLTYYRNRCIRSYYRNNSYTKRRINNIQIKDNKLNKTKL